MARGMGEEERCGRSGGRAVWSRVHAVCCFRHLLIGWTFSCNCSGKHTVGGCMCVRVSLQALAAEVLRRVRRLTRQQVERLALAFR